MLHHLSLGTQNIERAAAFYDAVLASLGYVRVWSDLRPGQTGQAVGYGPAGGGDKLAIKQVAGPLADVPGMHLAFSAPTAAAVGAFHAAALAAGGRDNGPPGLRPDYGADYFAAFVVDPDGHRLEAVCKSPAALPTPTLRTARLLLRPFAVADTDAVFELQSNPKVVRYWDAPAWTARVQAERFVAHSARMAQEGTGVRCAIERLADGGFVGWCCLVRWNPTFRSAELGYSLSDRVWRQGFATEAGDALLQWAFRSLDLNRVRAELDTRNVASARLLQKLGFRHEGTQREDCIVAGEVSDSFVYGLLRREWHALHPEPVGLGDAG